MYLGVGFPGRKAMKGIKRVSMVAATPAETMMIFRRRVILFFLRVRNIRMITMLGMIKWSALNIVRHTPEIISPEILLVWSFSRSQLSAKIAVNMAVSTKSNPLVVVCLVYVWFILLVSVVNLLQKCCKFEFFINFASRSQI